MKQVLGTLCAVMLPLYASANCEENISCSINTTGTELLQKNTLNEKLDLCYEKISCSSQYFSQANCLAEDMISAMTEKNGALFYTAILKRISVINELEVYLTMLGQDQQCNSIIMPAEEIFPNIYANVRVLDLQEVANNHMNNTMKGLLCFGHGQCPE